VDYGQLGSTQHPKLPHCGGASPYVSRKATGGVRFRFALCSGTSPAPRCWVFKLPRFTEAQGEILRPFGLPLVGDFSLPMSWTVHETLSTASNLRAEDCNGMSHRGNAYPWIRRRCIYEMERLGKTAKNCREEAERETPPLDNSADSETNPITYGTF